MNGMSDSSEMIYRCPVHNIDIIIYRDIHVNKLLPVKQESLDAFKNRKRENVSRGMLQLS